MEFRIKEIREKKNITLYKLSKSTGISKSYLKDLENNNKTNPSLLIMYKLSLVLEVSIEELFVINLENLRNKLHESIDKNGLSSKETISISKLLDLLINTEMKKKLKKSL